MIRTSLLGSYVAVVSLTISNSCPAALIADLAADYSPGALGQTSDDVGIPGSLAGSWHYFQDNDNTPADSNNTGLLHWMTDPDFENSESGYAGSEVVGGVPLPILSADRLFDGSSPAPPAGSLMGHPSNVQGVAIEYRAHPFGHVDNLSVDYRFEKPNLIGSVTIHIIETPSNSVFFSKLNLGVDAANQVASGTVSIGTFSPGEKLWLMLIHDGNNLGDQTWLQMTLNGNPVGVPEPACLSMVALAVCGLTVSRSRQTS